MVLAFSRSLAPSRSVSTIAPIQQSLNLLWEINIYLYHSSTLLKSMPKVNDAAQLNRTVTKLCKEGQLTEARRLFDKLAVSDVIAWTSMISAYMNRRMIREAEQLFHRADAKRNVVTWTTMVCGYIHMDQIWEAEKLFLKMPHKNVVAWNTMIDGYVRNGKIDLALSMFEKMPQRNVVSWNTILVALSQYGRIQEARKMFAKMPERDVISWTAMVACLSRNGDIDEAKEIFDKMPERNVVSWNAMITGYACNSRLGEALDLFRQMPERDISSWNVMITGFIQNKDLERARELFDEMPRKNVISWTTMITGYTQNGGSEEALRIFLKMRGCNGVKPNEATFVSVLSACADLACLCGGQQMHQAICKSVHQSSETIISSLINMYSKCGELGLARKMFDGFSRNRDLVSWNGMLSAYAHHGCGSEAIDMFKQMRDVGIKPNDVTYVVLLSACSHGGFVEEGFKYFVELVRDKSIRVRKEHYACLVDLCGRAGRLKEAFDFVQRLQIEHSSSVWGALLAGREIRVMFDRVFVI